jgi:organic radical activating enzyme
MDAAARMSPIGNVVITGGEPTIQMDDLQKLVGKLKECGYHVTIETNGTAQLDSNFADVIMVSPKDLQTADKWVDKFEAEDNVYLKFVVNKGNIANILEWAKNQNLTRLILMPQGITPQEVIEGSFYILEALMEQKADHIICPRTHILLGLR